MRKDFNFDTTQFARKTIRKLAGLIGLTIAIYIPFVAIASFGLIDKIHSGEITFTSVLFITFVVEVMIILMGLLGIGSAILGRKSIEWLTK